jgi:hypothetical protein
MSFVTLACAECGGELAQPVTGRPRRTCSSRCRQKAYRRRRLPPPLPVGLVEERREAGGFVWCCRCPRLWTWAANQAEARWLLDEHERHAHPKAGLR